MGNDLMNRVYRIALLIKDTFRKALQLQYFHALTKEALEGVNPFFYVHALPVSRLVLHRHATSGTLGLGGLIWFDNHPDHCH